MQLVEMATDPAQYDRPDLNWNMEGGMESPIRQFFWKKIMQHCPEWEGRRVLDIGAGTGWAVEAARREGAVMSVGLEPSTRNLKLARQSFPGIKMLQGTLEDYGTMQKYDRILSIMSLPHIRNLKLAFQKIRHLLAEPAGDFVAIVPNYDYYRQRRHDYEVQLEDLNSLEFVTKIKRNFGILTDLVRKEIAYVMAADETGLNLEAAEPMYPSEKLISEIPKYGNLPNQAITNFFRFKVP